jgi:hypothetical protein
MSHTCLQPKARARKETKKKTNTSTHKGVSALVFCVEQRCDTGCGKTNFEEEQRKHATGDEVADANAGTVRPADNKNADWWAVHMQKERNDVHRQD